MEPNRPESKYQLAALAAILLVLGIIWLFRLAGRSGQAPAQVPQRQSLPPSSALELPPLAPVPSQPYPFFPSITPKPAPKAVPNAPKSPRRKPLKKRSKIPSKWEIIKTYSQEIELDQKYIEIAILSDRYGYKNQAILYYRKYIRIAPTGPYAGEARQRLSQLETSP